MHEERKKQRQIYSVQNVRIRLEYFTPLSDKARRVYLSQVSPQRAHWKRICENQRLKEANNQLKGVILLLVLVILCMVLAKL